MSEEKYTDAQLLAAVPFEEQELIVELSTAWQDFHTATDRKEAYKKFRRASYELEKFYIERSNESDADDEFYNRLRG